MGAETGDGNGGVVGDGDGHGHGRVGIDDTDGGDSGGGGADRVGWRRLVGLPLVVALEVPFVLLLGSANDLTGAQTGLALLLIAGGTIAATGSAFLLRREEERAERALAAERAQGRR